ncbi:hypothetical protein [Spirosoma areae]
MLTQITTHSVHSKHAIEIVTALLGVTTLLAVVARRLQLRINEPNGILRALAMTERPAELYQQTILLQLELIAVERTVLSRYILFVKKETPARRQTSIK